MKLFCIVAILSAPITANAWDPFLRANSNVEEGNAHLKRHDSKQAIESYERAARELPSEAGVHIDRGLALLAAGKPDQARQAFLMATESTSATRSARADAYHNLGVVFYKQADAAAAENRHDEAQQLFREASDSFRRALRSQAGRRDSAWNLELSRRRIQDEAEKQKKEEQDQQKSSQQQDQKPEGSNDQNDSSQPEDGQKNPEDSSENQPQKKPDSSPSNNPSSPRDSQGSKSPQDRGEERNPGSEDDAESNPPSTNELPSSAAHVLDALQAGEENLERHQAKMRAQREHRKTVKDW